MIKLREPIVYCDVDDTLVSWEHFREKREGDVEFTDPEDGQPVYLRPNFKHIEQLKSHKMRGHTVVVWSQGGMLWAEEIVRKLGLEKLVDAVASKPNWFIDDLPAKEFMEEHKRIFIKNG